MALMKDFQSAMIDLHMRQHYQRLYSARPSNEILRTRPQSSTSSRGRRRPRSTSSSSVGPRRPQKQKLDKNKSLSSLDLNPNPHYWTDRFVSGEIFNGNHAITSEDDYDLDFATYGTKSFQSRPPHGKMKAPLAQQQRLMRSSMNDLPSTTIINNNMSDKIDEFLKVVQRCEAELQEEYEVRRQRILSRTRQNAIARNRSISSSLANSDRVSLASRKTSMMSSVSQQNLSSTTRNKKISSKVPNTSRKQQQPPRPPSSMLSASKVYGNNKKAATPTPTGNKRPLSRPQSSRPMMMRPSSSSAAAGSRPAAKHLIQEYPLPDTSKIISRLRQDRNYQPPRIRKKVAVSKKNHSKRKQQSNDYEDDFEEEEEADDDDDNGDADDDEEAEDRDMIMSKTKQWLDDQRQRGMARQRAMARYEKDSSKDSAYGFSGGETSRHQTREPTPDTFLWQQQKRPSPSKIQKVRQPPPKPAKSAFDDGADPPEESLKSTAYVNFLNGVTNSILRRGVFTDKGVRDTLEAYVRENGHEGINKRELDNLLAKLMREFGLQQSQSQGLGLLDQSSSNLKDLLYSTRQRERQAAAARRNRTSLGNLAAAAVDIEDLSDQELCNFLHEVDLDDSTVDEVIKAVRTTALTGNTVQQRQQPQQQQQHQPQQSSNKRPDTAGSSSKLRLFDNLNITDLNISFNANAQAAKEKRNQQRALLRTSFAKNHPGEVASNSRPKSAAANRRSSSRRPASSSAAAARQDSSSSNPDAPVSIAVPQRKNTAPPAAASGKARSQMPETPLHSSETPRSSSLYQPESEDEDAEAAAASKKKEDVDVEDSDISEEEDANNYNDKNTDDEGEVAEEVPDDDEAISSSSSSS